MSRFISSNHITGKVYDLTQENMNALIEAYEKLTKEYLEVNYVNAQLQVKLDKLRKAVMESF